MSDNANLLDIKKSCKVRRFRRYVLQVSAAERYGEGITYQPTALTDGLINLPRLPDWVTSSRANTPETVAFRSGAALTVLDQLVSDRADGVPVTLLANRLVLCAATATSKLEGQLAREANIRHAYHLTPRGEARRLDGDLLA